MGSRTFIEAKKSVFFASVLVLSAIGAVLFPPVSATARIGVCSNCHTMHNSQNGEPMARDESGNPVETPYSRLLVSTCIGCHTSGTSSTIVDNRPSVNNIVAPINMLAGGNFYHVNVADSFGHNAFESNPDDTLGIEPPGGAFPAGGTYEGQLRCAGTRGCHGYNGGHGETPVEDQLYALDGAHHSNVPPTDGSTVGKSYRFLYGIKGEEDGDWEHDHVIASHNEYMGSTDFADGGTVNYFCAECHGDYHSATGVGSSSPWLRHPAGAVLPVGLTEYEQYTTYSLTAPVARPDPFNVQDTAQVTPGEDMVMCLSCHRAHGSPYYKMMRWDYTSTDLSTALSGCGVCHTSKE